MIGKQDWIDRHHIGIGLALLGLWALGMAVFFHGHWAADLSALYFAGHFHAVGAPDLIYAAPPDILGPGTPASWAQAAAAMGHPGAQLLPYVYPPIWAGLLGPVTDILEPQTFFDAALKLQLACLALCPWLAWRIAGAHGSFLPWAISALAFLITSSASILAIMHAQPQIFVIFLTLLAFERWTAGHRAIGGALLGLAAAVKLSPVFLALIFLGRRDMRGFFCCVAVAGGLALTSLITMGPALHMIFVERLSDIDARVMLTAVNQSFEVVLAQIATAPEARSLAELPLGTVVAVPEPGWSKIGITLGMIVGLIAALWRTRDLPKDIRTATQVLLLAIVTNLTGPLGWAHYALLPIFLLPVMIHLLPGRSAARLWLALLCGLSLPAMEAMQSIQDRAAIAVLVPVALWTLVFLFVILRPNRDRPIGDAGLHLAQAQV